MVDMGDMGDMGELPVIPPDITGTIFTVALSLDLIWFLKSEEARHSERGRKDGRKEEPKAGFTFLFCSSCCFKASFGQNCAMHDPLECALLSSCPPDL